MRETAICGQISANARALDDEQRRELYSHILLAIKKSQRKNDLRATCQMPSNINIKVEKNCEKIVDLVNLGFNEFGAFFVWKLYEILCSGKTASQLGQYFTDKSVADFALSIIGVTPRKILDPMAGHGAFLLAASERFQDASLTGVDIDYLPLEAANLVLDNKVTLLRGDLFEWALDNAAKDSFSFDAIVGNPAYVSYQELQKVGQFYNIQKSYREYLLEVLKEVARKKGAQSELKKLLENWSGYSDLAVYALILSWLLLEDNGQIAFVTTNHWMEREYGAPVKDFLMTHGIINAVFTHKQSTWFPNAQIPTNIFVYTKRKTSGKQDYRGIPYIEISERLMKNKCSSKLLDSLERRSKSRVAKITFKNWISETSVPELPRILKKQDLFNLDVLGWDAHQGIRTGCNELFYVEKLIGNKYKATFTRDGKKTYTDLCIPSRLLIPAIQKVTSDDPLLLRQGDVKTYLLHLSETFLPEDYSVIAKTYPDNWKQAWKSENYAIMPSELAEHVRDFGSLPYEGKGGKRGPASTLSAVKTNSYSPAANKTNDTPSAPRFWYQIKVQPRHFGKIIIPRVSGSALRSYLINSRSKILTDANFITIIPQNAKASPELLWVWFNSNTFRLMAEINGVAMGGGALKVEAATAKRLPVPFKLLKNKVGDLFDIPKELGKQLSDSHLLRNGEEIDSVLFGDTESQKIRQELEGYLKMRKKAFQKSY